MALPAFQQPLGLNAQFVNSNGEELVLKEKLASLSGDSFSVMTATGQPVVQVKGEAMSLSGRKHVMDMNGNNIFDIRKEHLSLLAYWYCQDASGNKVIEIKSKFALGSSKATITFTNKLGGGQPVELEMKGDFLDRRASIVDKASGQTVAEIRKKSMNARNFLGGQQTYVVAVAPNVDLSVIVAMCVCFDEKNNEKH